MNKAYHPQLAILTSMLFCLWAVPSFAQSENNSSNENSAKQETEIIIIEKSVDANGNVNVNKTVRKGNFTDEEIEAIIAEEEATTVIATDPKPFLGVALDYSDEQGAVVDRVVEGSPAEKAGLQAGDILKAIDGEEVTSPTQAVGLVGDASPGDEITVTYSREGQPNEVGVVLGEKSGGMEKRIHKSEHHGSGNAWYSEEHVDKMHKQLERANEKPRFGVGIEESSEVEGVMVTSVYEGSLAEKAGLEDYDVIVSFDGNKVKSVDELIEAVQAAEAGKTVLVKYDRDGKIETTEVTFEK